MKKRNLFKIAALTAVFALAGMFANAQTNPSSALITANDTSGVDIKVIDNKGTVKYIQSNNGITTVTSTAPGNLTRTTFQLGGTLTDDTHIDVNGKIFALDGLAWENGPAAASQSATTGYTLLVRDEATGATRKMLLTDLIDAGTYIDIVPSDQTGATYVVTINGVTLDSFKTVYVFRNGAKLIAGVDYSVTNLANSTVTLHLTAAGTQYTPAVSGSYENFPLYQGDRIEVQFVK